jgi:hypothetical protein
VTVEMDAGTHVGVSCDWWLVVNIPVGWYHYDYFKQIWQPGIVVTHQGPLRNIPSRVVFQDPVSLSCTKESISSILVWTW